MLALVISFGSLYVHSIVLYIIIIAHHIILTLFLKTSNFELMLYLTVLLILLVLDENVLSTFVKYTHYFCIIRYIFNHL